MRHTEIAQAPRQRGHDGQNAVGLCRVGRHVIAGIQREIAGQRFRVGQNGVHAARRMYTEDQHHHQRDRHHAALDQVRGAGGQEAAQRRVGHDHDGADDHGQHIVRVEERAEQLAAGGKAGGRVGHEEHDDHNGRNGAQHIFVIAEALGEKLRRGDGIGQRAVAADALGHDQPVQIGAHRQADHRPAHVADTRQVSQAGQAHQQIAGHIRGLGAHGRDQRPQFAAAQIEIIRAVVLPGETDADIQHQSQIQNDGQQNAEICACHSFLLLPSAPDPSGSDRKTYWIVYHKIRPPSLPFMLFYQFSYAVLLYIFSKEPPFAIRGTHVVPAPQVARPFSKKGGYYGTFPKGFLIDTAGN